MNIRLFLVTTRSHGGFFTMHIYPRIRPTVCALALLLCMQGVAMQAMALESIPADSGWINAVTDLGCVADGKTDCTAALQAFTPANKHDVGTIYFPAGQYLIHDRFHPGDKRVVLQGAGREKSVIILAANSSGYGNADKPRAVVAIGQEDMNNPKSAMGQAFRNSVYDLGIEVGAGNPGAVALHYHNNNQGSVERVSIRAAKDSGKAGLGLVSNWPGPALIHDVSITGFDLGIWSTIGQYSITLDEITLTNQRSVGIHNQWQSLFIAHLHSENTVPAVINAVHSGTVVLIESELKGGDPAGVAIINRDEKKSKYSELRKYVPGLVLKNVRTAGYKKALLSEGAGAVTELPGGTVAGWASGVTQSAFPTDDAKALPESKMPTTPTVQIPPVSTWVSIETFAEAKVGDDWAPALQAAIDSQAEVVYLPRGQSYTLSSTIILRGKLRILHGMDRGFKTAGFKNDPEKPLFRVVDNGQPYLLIDRISDSYGDAAVRISHECKKPLIIRHSLVSGYRNTVPGGMVVLDDVCGADWEFDRQSVIARQFNVESKPPSFNVMMHGGSLWCLGFKTEYGQTTVTADRGARIDMWGAWLYLHDKTPDVPGFLIQDSTLRLAGLTCAQGNYVPVVREQRSEESRDLKYKINAGNDTSFRQYGVIAPAITAGVEAAKNE